jgi:hypothetical protein
MVPENDTQAQSKPVTRFQKVASALRGDRSDAEDGSAGETPAADRDAAAGTHAAAAAQASAEAEAEASAEAEAEAPAEAEAQAGGGLRPGQAAGELADFSDIAYGNLIPEAAEFRAQWQQIQFKFVDDPPASVSEAADVVARVTARLEAAIQERQRIIADRQRTLRDRWSEGANADTETLRETLRMYRGFLNQLLGSR